MRLELAGGITHPDPVVLIYTSPDNFDTLDWIGKGYSHFDVTCIGGGGGMGLGFDSPEDNFLKAFGGRGGGGGYHRVHGLLSGLSADAPIVVGSGGADGFEPTEEDPEAIATMYVSGYEILYDEDTPPYYHPPPTSKLFRVVGKENWQSDLDLDNRLDMEEVGDIGFGVRCMDIDPTSGILYAITHPESDESPNSLITIDKETGEGTLVGSLGDFPDPENNYSPLDITFLPDGTLVGLSSQCEAFPYPLLPGDTPDISHLRIVNKETGVLSDIQGNAEFDGGGYDGIGIFYNPPDESLYILYGDRLWRVTVEFNMADEIYCSYGAGTYSAAMDPDYKVFLTERASYTDVNLKILEHLEYYVGEFGYVPTTSMMALAPGVGLDPYYMIGMCFDPNINAVVDPVEGQPGGVSSFNITTCQASGGKGGNAFNPADTLSYDTSDANGGAGGIGDHNSSGGGAAGGVAGVIGPYGDGDPQSTPGATGILIGSIGQGGGGGAGGVGEYSEYFALTHDVTALAATSGGAGSSGDSAVTSLGTGATNDPAMDPATVDDPGITIVPGFAGGAKAIWASGIEYGRSSQDGVVVIRLTAE